METDFSSKIEICGEKNIGPGRHVKSLTKFSPGDLVLLEDALVTGPKLTHVLVCVQCLRSMSALHLCDRCGLPLCPQCHQMVEDDNSKNLFPSSHSTECNFLSINNIRFNPDSPTKAKLLLPLATIIRLLNVNSWRHLESNFYQRLFSKSWNFTEKNIIPHLMNLETCHFSNEEIHMAAGVLDTNCFEIKAHKKEGVYILKEQCSTIVASQIA